MRGEGGSDRQGTEDPAPTSEGTGFDRRMEKEREAKQGSSKPRNESKEVVWRLIWKELVESFTGAQK